MPTNTPIPWETYTDDDWGFSIQYRADWFKQIKKLDIEGGGRHATFATSAGYVVTSENGAAFYMYALPWDGPTDVQDVWDDVFSDTDAIGREKPIEIGGKEGLWAVVEDPDDTYYGWVALVISYNHFYLLQAVANPADAWDEYADTFDAMLESVEFFRPR